MRLQVLQPGANDYINASRFPPLLPGSPEYIACQGPTPDTVADFWKMVTQQNVRVLVMVTNLKELGKVKCHQYWPGADGETVSFAESPTGRAIDVTRTAERIKTEGWVERHFTVVTHNADYTQTSHHVQQFHFTVWPDRGVPTRPDTFIKYLHAVMAAQHKSSQGAKAHGVSSCPLLVHCSAGVGRTGTFCAIFSALSSLPYIGKDNVTRIDLRALVYSMRKYRRFMVQSAPQYTFCHKTVAYGAAEYQKTSRQHEGASEGGAKSPTPAPPAARRASAPPGLMAPASVPRAPPPAMRIEGRRGNAEFLNGIYVSTGTMAGLPVFAHIHGVTEGRAKGKDLILHYNAQNRAWAIAFEVGSKQAIAFVATVGAPPPTLRQRGAPLTRVLPPQDQRDPSLAPPTWSVTEAHGYRLDPNIRVTRVAPVSAPR